jgi:hypothetical protein
VLVGDSVGTRKRQHRYSWEAVGATWGRQRMGIGHLGQNSQFNAFPLHTSSAGSNASFSARPSRSLSAPVLELAEIQTLLAFWTYMRQPPSRYPHKVCLLYGTFFCSKRFSRNRP